MFSEITGVDENILKRVFVLLCIVNGRSKPDWDKVHDYGVETALLIETTYPWYRPSPSIHKLCLHARDAMGHLELPPGDMTIFLTN